MCRIIKILTKEKTKIEKEIKELNYLIFEFSPWTELVALREQAQEILNRKLCDLETAKLLKPLAIKEKKVSKLYEKWRKVALKGPERLADLQFDLGKINFELWRMGVKNE